MSTPLTENKIKRINGKSITLGWLVECASVYSDVALKMNWHAHDNDELICCLKGEMQYEFGNRKRCTLHAGEFLVIPADIRHRLSCGVDAPSRRVSFVISRRIAADGRLTVLTTDDLGRLRGKLLRKRYLPTSFSTDLRHVLVRLGDFLHSGRSRFSPDERYEMRHLCESVLIGCAIGRPKESPRTEVLLMDEAIAWMESHYPSHTTLLPLIEHMGYGRSQFYSLFRKKTGLSPNDYLIRLRIRKARKLLTQSDLSVRTVAERVGFRDPAFFSRTFKRLVGVSPTVSRKSARE